MCATGDVKDGYQDDMTLASKRLGMKLLVWLILFTILTVNLTSDLKASSTSTGFNLTHNFRVQEITTKVDTTLYATTE